MTVPNFQTNVPVDPPDEVVFSSFDFSRLADLKLLRDSIKKSRKVDPSKRWGGLDENAKDEAVLAVRVAMGWGLQNQNGKLVESCVRTMAMLEGQNQTDDHLADKNARLDAGKATENAVQRVYTAVFDGGTKL